MLATSSCHLSLSSASLAASVNDRPMVSTSCLTISIQCKGGGVYRGLFTSDTSRASVRACTAGELGAALMQWPNHFNLLRCTIRLMGSWPVLAYKPSFEMASSCLRRFLCHLSSLSSRVCLVVHNSLLYSRTLMTRVWRSLSFRPVGTWLCLKTTIRMVWSAVSV